MTNQIYRTENSVLIYQELEVDPVAHTVLFANGCLSAEKLQILFKYMLLLKDFYQVYFKKMGDSIDDSFFVKLYEQNMTHQFLNFSIRDVASLPLSNQVLSSIMKSLKSRDPDVIDAIRCFASETPTYSKKMRKLVITNYSQSILNEAFSIDSPLHRWGLDSILTIAGECYGLLHMLTRTEPDPYSLFCFWLGVETK
ncbi:MAG: hypothetical protein ACRCXZ_10490 [Patescibacteria group bacterium]